MFDSLVVREGPGSFDESTHIQQRFNAVWGSRRSAELKEKGLFLIIAGRWKR